MYLFTLTLSPLELVIRSHLFTTFDNQEHFKETLPTKKTPKNIL